MRGQILILVPELSDTWVYFCYPETDPSAIRSREDLIRNSLDRRPVGSIYGGLIAKAEREGRVFRRPDLSRTLNRHEQKGDHRKETAQLL